MSVTYNIPDTNLEDKFSIERLSRRGIGQFITMDNLILKTHQAMLRIINTPSGPTGGATITYSSSNPYVIDKAILSQLKSKLVQGGQVSLSLERLTKRIRHLEDGEKKSIDDLLGLSSTQTTPLLSIPDILKLYCISMTLQRMISYSLINMRRVLDFKADVEIIQRSLAIYGTTDRVDRAASQYSDEVLRENILDSLEDGISGSPLSGRVPEILITFAKRIGFLFGKESDSRADVDSHGDVLENKAEKDLLAYLFPSNPGSIQRHWRRNQEYVQALQTVGHTADLLFVLVSEIKLELDRSNRSAEGESELNHARTFIDSLRSVLSQNLSPGSRAPNINPNVLKLLSVNAEKASKSLKAGIDKIEANKRKPFSISLDELEKQLVNQIALAESMMSAQSFTDHSIHQLSRLLELSGMAAVLDKFDDILPDDDIYGIANSATFDICVNSWAGLFDETQPEIIDLLVGLLPTVQDRFAASSTNSQNQQEIKAGGFNVMKLFLEDALQPIRLADLNFLLNNPSANNCLYYFRSLLVLSREKNEQVEWTAWTDKTGRLKYMRLVIWVLSETKDLSELFEYALSIMDENDEEEIFENVSWDVLNKLVPSAMFPGTLEAAEALPQGGMLIDMNYNREQKNKENLLRRLSKPRSIQPILKQVIMP